MMNNNEIREMMEDIFEGICIGSNKAWYEVFDGDLMDEVDALIANRLGCSVEELEDNEIYLEWTSEMLMDL